MSKGKITFRKPPFGGMTRNDLDLDTGVSTVTVEVVDTNEVSDGYHSYGELYDHRTVLFALVTAMTSRRTWRSRQHEDGSMFEGMFIVGWEAEDGEVTYHVEDRYWHVFGHCQTLERAPHFDGYTAADILKRLIEHLAWIGQVKDA